MELVGINETRSECKSIRRPSHVSASTSTKWRSYEWLK